MSSEHIETKEDWMAYKNTTRNGTIPMPVWHGGLCNLDDVTGIHVFTTLLIILAILSTLENLVVLFVIIRNKILHTPSMLLLGVLASIDCFTGLVVTPIKANLTQHPNILMNIPLVKAFSVLFMATVILSLSTVMLISFERFAHVYFLDNYNLTKKKVLTALLCTWVVPVIFLILMVSDTHIGFAGGVFALVYFFACIVAMIVAYVATIVTLRNYASNSYYEVQQDLIDSQRRAVKTVLIIVIVFIVMNIPPILSVALLFMGVYSGEMCAVTFFVMLANSAVNPWIYCLRIPQLKEKVMEVLRLPADINSPGNVDEFRDISITEPNGTQFQDSVVVFNDAAPGGGTTPRVDGDYDREVGGAPGGPGSNDADSTRDVALRKYVNF